MFTDINIFTYRRPLKLNVKTINYREAPARGFVLVLIKYKILKISIPLWPSYYMPQNPQTTIIQTSIKHYNQFRGVRAEALRWLQITTDAGKKIRVGTEAK